MTPREALEVLEAGRKLSSIPQGTGAELFARVADLMGQDPAASYRLARRGRYLENLPAERAYALRARAAAEWATGRYLQAVASFRAAGDAAEGADRYAFQIGAVDALGRLGKAQEACRLADALVRPLKRAGRPELAARADLNAANALLWQDRNAEARRRLLRALPSFEAAGMVRESASALLGLSTLALQTGRHLEALAFAERAEAAFQDQGADHHSALARINIAHASLAMGRADEALDLLVAIRDRLAAAGPSADLARVHEFLGEAFRVLQLPTEAADCYRDALHLYEWLPPLNRGNVRLGLAMVELELGRPAEAESLSSQALRAATRVGSPAWTAQALTVRAKARARLDRHTQARRDLVEAERLASTLDDVVAKIEVWLAVAEIRAEESAALSAVREAKKRGLALEWRAHAWAAALGPRRKRRQRYRSMVASLAAARMRARSVVARAGIYGEAREHLASFVGELLDGTQADRREALRVLAETRAATLLDELVSSGVAVVEVEEPGGDRPPRGPAASEFLRSPLRRAELSDRERRRWVERFRAQVSGEGPSRTMRPEAGVWVMTEVGGRWVAIESLRGGGARPVALGCDRSTWESRIRWARFEIAAPSVTPDDDGSRARRLLDELRELLSPLDGEEPLRVSAEGALWSIPWAALWPARDIRLCLHPFAPLASPKVPHDARVAVWMHDGTEVPHIGAEVERVCAAFPRARVFRTADEIRRSWTDGPWDLVHVAAHGRFEPKHPMFSALEVGGVPIRALEIAQSPLRARAVVLAACDSGQLGPGYGREPAGLARAFLARGAQAVVASQWPLHDQAAVVAVESLLENLTSGRDFAESTVGMRVAARAAHPHPFYHATWTYFGGYAS